MKFGTKINVPLILLFVLLVGGALRESSIGKESVWQDEGFALRNAQQDTLSEFAEVIKTKDGTPPLYFFFLKYWLYGGNSEWWIRLPSALFSTLAILFTFLIGKEIGNEKLGISAATLMTFSAVHVIYAQEARPYALFTLLITLSTWQFLSMAKGKFSAGNSSAVAYVIFTSLMLYVHQFALFVLALQVFSYFWFFHRAEKARKTHNYVFSIFLILLFYAPNFLFFTRHQFANVQRSLRSSLAHKIGVPTFAASLGGINLIILFGIVILLLHICLRRICKIGAKKIENELGKRKGIIFCFLAFLMFLAGASFYRFPVLLGSVFVTRYTHWAYLPAYLAISYLFLLLKKRQKEIIAALYIFLVVFSFSLYYSGDRKEQWREVAGFMKGKENIYIIDDSLKHPYEYYSDSPAIYIDTNAPDHGRILEGIKKSDDFWVIYSHAYEVRDIYENAFKEYGKETRKFIGVEAVHYAR